MRKHKQLHRGLALLLCLSMVLSFLPASVLPVFAISEATNALSGDADYPRLYFSAEELKSVRSYKNDTEENAYGFSWSSQYDALIKKADAYLNETEVEQYSNYPGAHVTFKLYPTLDDPNDEELNEAYINASLKEDGVTPVEEPHLGFGCGFMGTLQTRLETLSLAYALSGDEDYAERAISYVMQMCDWEFWGDKDWLVGQGAGYVADACVAWATQGIAAVYDLCNDKLTDVQKSTIETKIKTHGLELLYQQVETNSIQNANMILAGGLLTGIAAIIDDDNTGELQTYVTKALQCVDNALNSYANSGNTEGHYYTNFGLEYFLPGLYQYCRVTGTNTYANNAFLTQTLPYWTVMFAAPSTNTHPSYSDSSVDVYMEIPMAIVSKMTDNSLADYFLTEVGGLGDPFWNIVYLDPNPTVEAPSATSAIVDSIGYGALRTGFAVGDMLLTLKANNSQMDHNHYDQNSILLNVGGKWLISDPGAGSYYYEDETTKDFYKKDGHSTILVDGVAQSVMAGTNNSVNGVFDSSLYSYMIGSAADAYGSLLSKFDRHAIQINHSDKAYYVIIDDLASASTHNYGWQMFNGTRGGFTVDGVAVAEGENATGSNVTMPLGSNTLNLSFVGDSLNIADKIHNLLDTNNEPFTAKTLVATTTAAAAAHQFMTVISAGEAVAVTEQVKNENVVAAKINYSGNKYDYVMFNVAGGSQPAGAMVTDAAQASVLGLVNGIITEGFAATGVSTLVYGGKTLLTADSALDIVVDRDGWHIDTEAAQTVTLYVGDINSEITFNGAVVTPDANKNITVALPAGESTIAVTLADEEEIVAGDAFANGDFEDGENAWNGFDSNSTVADVDGNKVLNVNNAASSIKQAFVTDPRTVIDITLKYKHLAGEGDVYLAMYFYQDKIDKSNLVGTWKTPLVGTANSWEDISAKTQVPDGANIAEIRIETGLGVVASYQIDDVTIETAPSMLYNPDFELGVLGWDNAPGTSSSNDAYSGNASMLIADEANDSAVYVYQKISVEPGKTYHLTAKVKNVSGQGGYFGFYGMDGTGANAQTGFGTSTTDTWTTYEVWTTIPDGCTEAHIEIGASSSQVVSFLIDGLTIVECVDNGEHKCADCGFVMCHDYDKNHLCDGCYKELSKCADTDGNLVCEYCGKLMVEDGTIANGDFENFGSGLPEGWVAAGTQPKIIYDTIRGSNVMMLNDPDASAVAELKSTKFAVKPGAYYDLSFALRQDTDFAESAVGDMDVFFFWYHEDGSVTTPNISVKAGADWSVYNDTIGVPDTATHLALRFNFHASDVNCYYIDDVKFEKSNVIFSDDFETNIDANGWTTEGGARASRSATNPYAGTYTLTIQDNSAAAAITPAMAVVPGYTYTATFMESNAKFGDGNYAGGEGGYATLYFVNAIGQTLQETTIKIGKNQGYQKATLQAMAPANAVSAYLKFGIASDYTASPTYRVDNLVIRETEGEVLDPVTEVINGDFENGNYAWSGVDTIVEGAGHNGSNAALISAYKNHDTAIYPTVIAGETYKFSFYAKGYGNSEAAPDGISSFVVWRNAANTTLSNTDPVTINRTDGWTLYESEFTAPENAVGAVIRFAGLSSGSSSILVDDVVFGVPVVIEEPEVEYDDFVEDFEGINSWISTWTAENAKPILVDSDIRLQLTGTATSAAFTVISGATYEIDLKADDGVIADIIWIGTDGTILKGEGTVAPKGAGAAKIVLSAATEKAVVESVSINLLCADEDNDHYCDDCKIKLSDCVDDNEDNVCDICGESLEVPHECTPADPVIENKVDPDCTTAGSYDSVVYCTECNKELSRETITVPAPGHTEETVTGKPATCTEAGLTDGTKCSVCGETLVAQEEIPALGHTYSIDADSTCNECGYQRPYDEVTAILDSGLNFTNHNLKLESELKLRFRIESKKVANAKDYFVVFYKADGVKEFNANITLTVSKENIGDPTNGNYYAQYPKILAAEMGDKIEATLYVVDADGTVRCSAVDSYSAQDYLYSMLEKYPAYVTEKDDMYYRYMRVAVELLNYGAGAQVMANYKLDALVNKDLTEQQKADYMLENDPEFVNIRDWGEGNSANEVVFMGSGLSFEECIYSNVRIDISNLTSTDKNGLSVHIKDKETGNTVQIVTGDEFNHREANQYYAPISGILPKDYAKAYTIQVFAGDKAVSSLATYSVASYAKLLQASGYSTDSVMAALRYCAATAYLASYSA